MSTRPDPERSGAVEIATRRRPRLRLVWNLRELTHKNPSYGAFPPDSVQLRFTLPFGALVLGLLSVDAEFIVVLCCAGVCFHCRDVV